MKDVHYTIQVCPLHRFKCKNARYDSGMLSKGIAIGIKSVTRNNFR